MRNIKPDTMRSPNDATRSFQATESGNPVLHRVAVFSRQPDACPGQKTILHLTIEADDIGVIEAVRAALPEGSRVHFRSAGHTTWAGAETATAPPAAIRPPELTGRQRDILALLMEGLSNKEIGRKLALSHFTVRNHIQHIMRGLNASNRREAVAKAKGMTGLERNPSLDVALADTMPTGARP